MMMDGSYNCRNIRLPDEASYLDLLPVYARHFAISRTHKCARCYYHGNLTRLIPYEREEINGTAMTSMARGILPKTLPDPREIEKARDCSLLRQLYSVVLL